MAGTFGETTTTGNSDGGDGHIGRFIEVGPPRSRPQPTRTFLDERPGSPNDSTTRGPRPKSPSPTAAPRPATRPAPHLPAPETRDVVPVDQLGDTGAILATLSEIGRDESGGYTRLALSDVDRQLRQWFETQAGLRHMAVEVDSAGNQWAWWRADRAQAAARRRQSEEESASLQPRPKPSDADVPITGRLPVTRKPATDNAADADADADARARPANGTGARSRKPNGTDARADGDAAFADRAFGDSAFADSAFSDGAFADAAAPKPARRAPIVMRADLPSHLPIDRRCVVVGSHLDSTPQAGPLAGPLGIAAAFAAIDRMRLAGLVPLRDLAVVNFLEHEGARFGREGLGSQVVTGAIAGNEAAGLVDAQGTLLARAWSDFGLPGTPTRDTGRIERIGRFVELHIEQGIAQADLAAPVAVCSAIWPHGRWRVTFDGEANHAGTTPMRSRRDPMPKLARFIEAAQSAALASKALATVGRIDIEPGDSATIPSKVSAWLDVRAASEDAVRAVIGRLAWAGPQRESWNGALTFDPSFADWLAATAFEALPGVPDDAARTNGDASLAAGAEGSSPSASRRTGAAPSLGRGRVPLLATGAGHDAGVLAEAGVRSGLLFVRNPSGASHTRSEQVSDADEEAGTLALTAVLTRLLEADRLDDLC